MQLFPRHSSLQPMSRRQRMWQSSALPALELATVRLGALISGCLLAADLDKGTGRLISLLLGGRKVYNDSIDLLKVGVVERHN